MGSVFYALLIKQCLGRRHDLGKTVWPSASSCSIDQERDEHLGPYERRGHHNVHDTAQFWRGLAHSAASALAPLKEAWTESKPAVTPFDFHPEAPSRWLHCSGQALSSLKGFLLPWQVVFLLKRWASGRCAEIAQAQAQSWMNYDQERDT